MKLLRCLALMCFFAGTCHAQLPEYYQSINRVTWLSQNMDAILPAWIALGMTDIHKYAKVKAVGTDHGKPTTIYARQVTGRLGNLTVNFLQPTQGQVNSYQDFLQKHKDGIFAVVHEVLTREEMDKEIQRMASLGVSVLQQVTIEIDHAPVTYTYFDTEPLGKYVLGLVYWPGGAPKPLEQKTVSHIAPVVRDAAAVRDFWQRLGFPGFELEHATPRDDSRYRGQPLSLAFEVGFQHLGSISYEWIQPPATPANIYEDFLTLHGEGIQHIGMPVDDLSKATAAYEKLGFGVWQAGAWGDVGKPDSGQYHYMDTDKIGGVSVELIHAY
ncbi:MAG TPA: VOC family protein [Candidatus Sulfotelmatobacter sp.]|nr:VOC family protein [Candidatus Sulfotelmatobacter sp.]